MAVQPSASRNVAMAVFAGVAWALFFWIVMIFVIGAIAGSMDPGEAQAAGARAGERFAGVCLLIAVIASGALSAIGILPGTRKHSRARSS
jgi:hypothetical protein